MKSVGQLIFAFFEDYLKTQKGLRPGSIRSYRDTLKLFLAYVASNCRRPITRLILSDLAAQRVLDFLHMIEVTRGNHVSTRNQRLAALHTFYRYLGLQYPEMLAEAQRVEAIPMKRTAPPQTDYLEHDEIETLFKTLPRHGSLSLRDRGMFLVLFKHGGTGAGDRRLTHCRHRSRRPITDPTPWKGRQVAKLPTLAETAEVLKTLTTDVQKDPTPLFICRQRKPLTRFGIYKIVKLTHSWVASLPLQRRNIAAFPLMSSATPRRSGFWSRASRST